MISNLALGKAGELRVASELLLRGIDVYLSIVDSGVDLRLGDGKRVQVKTAHRTKISGGKDYWKCQHYVFSFKSWRKVGKHYESHPLQDVDYVILWAIEDDDFFIVPAGEIRGSYSIHITPTSTKQQSKYMVFKDAWDSLK